MPTTEPPDIKPWYPAPEAPSKPPWWRVPLLMLLIVLPLLSVAGGVILGCDAGLLHLPLCGGDAPYADAGTEVVVSAGQTTVAVAAEPGEAPVVVAQEPTSQFASQFKKFVVVAPDEASVIYVTAASLGMTDANLWFVPRGQPKQLLKHLGDDFWIARPVWCQAGSGDLGIIAYVLKGPVGPDTSGLELWVIDAEGSNDRRVLVGSEANGFTPDLFYGERLSPLRFAAGCKQLRYSHAGDTRPRVINLDSGEVREPLTLPAATLAPTQSAAATATPAASVVRQPCRVKPFAQTDPRWANQIMHSARTTIHAWGCALTSTAMIFHYYGVDTDPGRLATCAGDQADVLYWDPVRARCAADHVPNATRWLGQATWADVEQALAGGRPVIVGLQGGPAGSHFVVVTAGSGDDASHYSIVDSWDGSTYKTLADYINPQHGYHLRWLVIFEGTPPLCEASAAAPVANAGVVTFLSPTDGGLYNTPQVVRYQVSGGQAAGQVTSSVPDGTTIASEGPQAVRVSVTRDGQTHHRELNFIIDLTPPTVSASWQPLSASSGRLTLTASDDLTAVTEADYRIDDEPWRPINPSSAESQGLGLAPIILDHLTPGHHRIRYYAVDSAGNKSPEAELEIHVGPPEVALLLDGAPLRDERAAIDLAAGSGERHLVLANDGDTPLTVTIDRPRLAGWVRLTVEPGASPPAAAATPAPTGQPAADSITVEPKQRLTIRLGLLRDQVPAGHQLTSFTLTVTEPGEAEPVLRISPAIAVSGATPPPPPKGATPRVPARPGQTATPSARPPAGGTATPGKADLATTLQMTGSPTVNDQAVKVPVQVTIANQGQMAADSFQITATYAAGGASGAVAFTVQNQANSASPTVPGLAPGGTVRLVGTLMLPRALAGQQVDLTVSADSCGGERATRLYCRVDEHDEHNNHSSVQSLTIANPQPTLTRLPDAAPSSTPGQSDHAIARPTDTADRRLVVEGVNFVPDSVIRLAGRPLPTRFIDPTHLEITITAQDLPASGSAGLTVINPAPGGGESHPLTVKIINPVPAITGLTGLATDAKGAPLAIAGGPGLTLTLLGAGFAPGATARWDGHDRPTTVVSATELRVTVTAADLARVHVASLTVVNPSPGGGTSPPLKVPIVANPKQPAGGSASHH